MEKNHFLCSFNGQFFSFTGEKRSLACSGRNSCRYPKTFAVQDAKIKPMKKRFFTTVLLGVSMLAFAQDPPAMRPGSFPITVSIFSESVSLPQFRTLFKNPNLGVRVGTEVYYSKNRGNQLLQTFHVGYYRHKDFQSGLFLSSEFGYRKFIHNSFVDVTAGVGYLRIDSALPRYKKVGNDYQAASSTFGRIMPTVGLGVGHQFDRFAVFSRYEFFGEMPFGFRGVPALPHQALHLGTRFNLK